MSTAPAHHGRPTSKGLSPEMWRYAALRSWHGFTRHRGFDSAGALAYFSALALFPGSLALVSAFALVDDKRGAESDLLDVVASVASADTVDALRGPIEQLLSIPNPGIALGIALALLLWTTSSYATAFGRALNTAYEVQEGRLVWKFRGLMLIIAAALIVCFSGIGAILLLTPAVADAVARSLGISAAVVVTWNIAKWPLLAALALLSLALLYYFSPNVRHLRFRWVSWGALFAIVAWSLATIGFAFYVLNVAKYNEVYGWLGGAVVMLLWLYLTNFVLVLGAEVDSEIVRARQLDAGMEAEEVILLPLRDTTRNLLLARQLSSDVQRGRELRERAAERDPDAGP